MTTAEATAAVTGADRRSAPGLLRRARGSRLCLVGGSITAFFLLVGLAGLTILAVPALHDLYAGQELTKALEPPGDAGLLGTDQLGRSLLWRTVVGVGISTGIGLAVTAFSILVGGVLGLLSGYRGGWADRAVSGVVNVTWGFPVILVAVVLAGVFRPGLTVVVLSISLILWAGFARVIRGEALALRNREFVKAARILGIPERRILVRHLVPNVVGPTLVLASYYMAVSIIAEAALSFIGVGVQLPTPSLGAMIAEGREYWDVSVWVVAVPGTALALLVLGLNALADGLRDVVNPRLRERG